MNNLSDLTAKIKKQNQSLQQSIENQLESDKQELQLIIKKSYNDARNTIVTNMLEYQNKLQQQIEQEQQAITTETIQQIFSAALKQLTQQQLESFHQSIQELTTQTEATHKTIQNTSQNINKQLESIQQNIEQQVETTQQNAQKAIQENHNELTQAFSQYTQNLIETTHKTTQEHQEQLLQAISDKTQQASEQYQGLISTISEQQKTAEQTISKLKHSQHRLQEQAESMNLSRELTEIRAQINQLYEINKEMMLILILLAILILFTLIIAAIEPTRSMLSILAMIVIPVLLAVAATYFINKQID